VIKYIFLTVRGLENMCSIGRCYRRTKDAPATPARAHKKTKNDTSVYP